MTNRLWLWIGLCALAVIPAASQKGHSKMELGRFSVSLTVKDLAKSRAFYEKLGFQQIDGKQEQNWLIMGHGEAKIGLFQGMFDQNILTFNPTDARGIEKTLKAQGLKLEKETTGTSGPAHLVLKDPDGNTILIDQHQ